jgi:lysophospholipase L1-like esterase
MSVESTDPLVLAPHSEDALLRAAPWRRLAMLGDSIVAGVGEPLEGYRTLPWGDRVAAALRRRTPGLQYLNVAERDRTVAEIADDQLPGVLAFAPDLVVVNGGGNDMFRAEFAIDDVRAVFEPMVARLVGSGATVVTFTMLGLSRGAQLPEPWGSRLMSRYALVQRMVREVAATHRTVLVDYERHPASGDPGIYASDLIHLNMRGHAIVASAAMEALGASVRDNVQMYAA